MRERNCQVNIRLTENEKKKIERLASKSHLNVSSYLRNTGLNKVIYSFPQEEFYNLYKSLKKLHNDFDNLYKDEIKAKIKFISDNVLSVYLAEGSGDEDGNNENMAH